VSRCTTRRRRWHSSSRQMKARTDCEDSEGTSRGSTPLGRAMNPPVSAGAISARVAWRSGRPRPRRPPLGGGDKTTATCTHAASARYRRRGRTVQTGDGEMAS
jgi:hypothetical protein